MGPTEDARDIRTSTLKKGCAGAADADRDVMCQTMILTHASRMAIKRANHSERMTPVVPLIKCRTQQL
jgi:hypothetical protein